MLIQFVSVSGAVADLVHFLLALVMPVLTAVAILKKAISMKVIDVS